MPGNSVDRCEHKEGHTEDVEEEEKEEEEDEEEGEQEAYQIQRNATIYFNS